MNIQRRVLGSSAITARNGEISGVDFDLLIHRLLLFDGYVLRTVRFKEVPFLLAALGYDQTLELLKCGLLEIRCEVRQIGSMRDQELKRLNRLVFDLVWIREHDWEEHVSNCLRDIRSQLSLPDFKWNPLEASIRQCIRRMDDSVTNEIAAGYAHTVDTCPAVLLESTRLAARRRRIPIVLPGFRIDIERKDDELTYADTDLRYTRIPKEEIWEIVRDGLMGIGTLEQVIGEMKGHQAIGGFSVEELPVFEKKLSGLANLTDPGETERRAARVAKVVGLPRFDPTRRRLRIDRLLAVRESNDLRIFRDWLATASDKLTDGDVRKVLKGYRVQVAEVARSGSGSMLRLITEGGIGFNHPVAGIALSVLDWFVLDKLLSRSGPAALVNKTFPSIFDRTTPPEHNWEAVRGLS